MTVEEFEFLLSTEDFIVMSMAYALRENEAIKVSNLEDWKVKERLDEEIRVRKLEKEFMVFCKHRKYLSSVPNGIIFKMLKMVHSGMSDIEAEVARDLLTEILVSFEQAGVNVSIDPNLWESEEKKERSDDDE